MKKKPDWEIIFDAYLNRNLKRPFEWGKWDCVMLTNGFIQQISGDSLLPESWSWKNEQEAMQSIMKYGKGKGLVAGIDNAVEKQTGISEVNPQYITKGDFGVYKEESELCCIFDNYYALGANDQGIVLKKDVDIVKAWRIDG
tara:strand:+ start:691 stop:1116 length:426 start_codon:yes stop_codon:yes gene_type:complete